MHLIESISCRDKRFALFIISSVLAVACSKPGTKSSAEAASAADAAPMKEMKTDTTKAAMVLPETITLSAAAVQHGHVRWAPVSMTKAAATAIVPGQVVPDEDRTARLGAPARGRVLSVLVQAGDRVSAGQALATLASTDASIAQADVIKAIAALSSQKAQANYARSARDRAQRLLVLKAIPRQEYERAIADDELAQSALTAAQAEVRRAQSTASQLGASGAAGEITIRSPRRGVVLARTAMPGAVVEAGAPLVVVTDPGILWLAIDAPERFSTLFRVPQQIHFTVPAYAATTFTGQVASIGAGLMPDTRTLPVRAVIANEDLRLKPEMVANVLIAGGNLVPAVVLPDSAVQLLENAPTIFIVHANKDGSTTFARRSVEILSRTGGYTAISKGLVAGDVVVIAGALAVKAEFAAGNMPKMEM